MDKIQKNQTAINKRVAALYVQTDGCYSSLPHIDAWDIERDAKKYRGPLPVIAHPPCQRWGKMAKVNYARWGGEHNRPGSDGGTFACAIRSVERWGGVLEHPAQTYAWAVFGIPKPGKHGWYLGNKKDSYVCEVWQSAYGHRANKATWLYYVGLQPPFDLIWDRPVGSHQVGFQDQRGKANNKPTLSKSEANATPVDFRNELIKLAEWSREVK